MSAESSPKANPATVFQSGWYRLVLLVCALYLTVLWFVLGPSNPLYAINVAAGTFALAPAIGAPLERRLPRRWFRASRRERPFHRIAGVGMFGRLLDGSGWNRRVAEPLRGFSGKRGDLSSLERGVRANISAHGAGFAIHAVLAVLALFGRHPWRGALWMLVPAIFIHLYPVLLQRSILLRLRPLLDKPPVPARPIGD